jgi:hypothetical protein
MKTTLIRKAIGALVFVVIAGSCTLIVDLDLPNQSPKLVVNSLFNTDSLWNVEVSSSVSSIGYDEPGFLKPDNLKLFENGTEITDFKLDSAQTYDRFGNITYRYFYSSITSKPQAAKTYRIEVSKAGFESVYSETVGLDRIVLNNITVTDSARKDDNGNYVAEMNFDFNDNNDQKNYYSLQLFTVYDNGNEEYYYPTLFYSQDIALQENFQRDPFDNNTNVLGEAYYGQEVQFSDKLFLGTNKSIKIYIPDYTLNDPSAQVYVRFGHLSEGAFSYVLQARAQQENQGNPFAEPVQVYTNIVNGLGVFAGANYSFIKIR